MDESVGGDVGRDDEGGDTDAEAREVVRNIDTVTEAGEGDTVLGSGDVYRWWNMVCKAAVFVEVNDDKSIIPVA